MKTVSNSTSTLFCLLIVILIIIPNLSKCQMFISKPKEDIHHFFKEILNNCQMQNFDEAFNMAFELRKKQPNEPASIFSLIITYQTIMDTYRICWYENELDSLISCAIDVIEGRIEEDKIDGMNYFYYAMANGARSARFARHRKWFDAFKDSRRLKKNLEISLELNPDIYDAYYGLGLYNYWSSVKAKFLGFFVGDKKRGVEQIKLAIEKGQFMKTSALFGLMVIHIHKKQFDEALKICLQLHKKYPKNPTLTYRIGRIYEEFKGWEKAKNYFFHLHEILSNTKYKSISFLIDCYYHLANCEFYLDNYKAANNYCEKAILLEPSCDFSREMNGQYEKYPEIRMQIRELKKKLEIRLVN